MSNVLKHLFHVKIVFRSKKICLTYDGKNANEKRYLHDYVCLINALWTAETLHDFYTGMVSTEFDKTCRRRILLAEIYRMTFALIFNSGRVKYSSPKRSSAGLTCVLLHLYK